MKKTILALLVIAGLVWLASLVVGFEYVENDTLKKNLVDYVGKPIKIKDEVIAIWKNQSYEGYLKFDTVYFSCIIKDTKTEDINLLREAQTLGDVKVAIYGSPRRKDFWDSKRAPEIEHILIEVEKIEKSRQWKLKEKGK